MKKLLAILTAFCISLLAIQAQEPRFIFTPEDSIKMSNNGENPRFNIDPPKNTTAKKETETSADSLNKVLPAIPSWKIDTKLGERIPTPMDTTLYGFNQQSLVDGKDVAVGYLANWGSPALTKIYFNQNEQSNFVFLDAFNYYYRKPEDQLFLNTKQPYSNITYQSGGGRQSKEERLTGEMSISFNKYLNVGAFFDYVYSRGYYTSLSNKQINANAFVSYTAPVYQMHAFIGSNSYNNLENGGIVDSVKSELGKEQSLNLPTNIRETWNRLYGTQIYVTNKYNVGFKTNAETNDSIPMVSFIFTTHYEDQRRRFYSNQTDLLNEYYGNERSQDFYGNLPVNDHMSFWNFKNTLGISINEGFRDWVKFGLSAYIEQDIRRYSIPNKMNPTIQQAPIGENATFIGGVLSKNKGKYLRYKLAADIGIIGVNLGEFKINADLGTTFQIKNREIVLNANGYIKNLTSTFLQSNFVSKYYTWDKNFNDTRKVFVGGELYVPSTQTRLSGGVENIQNLIYLDKRVDEKKADIYQASSNIQVVSLRLDQKLSYRALHWDNQLVFQTGSNESVLPLPKLSLYTNVYALFKVAKVLKVQLGVDAHYFSKYYSQAYDPALLQFYNQHENKVGNFPIATAYANLHLKKTRFFVMMYNVLGNTGKSEYLTLPNYPVNPMIFKFGLSWNFTN